MENLEVDWDAVNQVLNPIYDDYEVTLDCNSLAPPVASVTQAADGDGGKIGKGVAVQDLTMAVGIHLMVQDNGANLNGDGFFMEGECMGRRPEDPQNSRPPSLAIRLW